MKIEVNYDEFMFLQCRTCDYHYVGEKSKVNVENTKVINGKTCYYIRWEFSDIIEHNWYDIDNLNYICNAHKQWLGVESHTFKEWNKILQTIKRRTKEGRE